MADLFDDANDVINRALNPMPGAPPPVAPVMPPSPEDQATAAINYGLANPNASAGQPAATGGGYHGQLLPFSTDAQGRPRWDWNAGIPGALRSALSLPGDVATGAVQTPYSSTGQMSPDLMARTVGLASMLMMDAPGAQLPRTSAPTARELKAASNAGYDRLNNSGITVKGSEVSNLADNIRQNLTDNFFPQQAAPATHAFLDQLGKTGDLDFPQFNALWKRVTDTMMAGGSEGAAAASVRRQLGDFWGNLQDTQMTPAANPTMTAPEAAQAFNDARANAQGAFKSNELVGGLGKGDTGMLQRAETRAAA